ncbi:MAG TPA: PstS family phosphate ABC transporter substrate-binding protein [Candidatus Binatia bacterium]|nr:PstS family phosphate ABC transporter substrate-binding protein [Candidatus Binatia bacterium]
MKAACALFASLGLLLAACGDGGAQKQGAGSREQIAIDGSSTVFPLVEAAAESFSRSATGAARVTVGESGTGGGFRKFCRGETQISNASRPISAEEMQACAAAGVQYVEIPIAFDGIGVVVHPSNPVDAVTMGQLRQFWQPSAERTVTNWNQVNSGWPDLGLQLFGPGTASGTFDFFTEAVNGDGGASRTDYTPSEDDNVVVQGVAGNAGALGYFGYAYYEQNRERVKALEVNGVSPSPETIASGRYPLSRPVFIYVNAEALRRPQVRRFVMYFVQNAATLAPQVGYVALPADAYAAYGERVTQAQTGTAFGGDNEVGLSIEQLMARPLSTATPAPQ